MLFNFVLSATLLASYALSATFPPITSLFSGSANVTSGDEPEWECTDSIDWISDGWEVEDCRAAVQGLYNIEVARHRVAEFEFLSPGASKETAYDTMTTPRRYTAGKCTLAIVMLDWFPRGSLPGLDPSSEYDFPETDVASFDDLWLTADMIEVCCLVPQPHLPGWAPIGHQDSIGVFLWSTGSWIDRLVPRGPPTFGGSLNVTRSAR